MSVDVTSDEAMIRASDLSAGYGAVPVLHGVSITVAKGEVVALLGANGAGKTTLLSTLAGTLRPLMGQVMWKGEPASLPPHRMSRDGLAYLTEERSVFTSLTTGENLRLGSGGVEGAVKIMPELGPLLRRNAGLLSGGEQQMLVLARALASNPVILLADELSLGLAPLIIRRLMRTLRDAANSGVGVLLVEQHVRSALSIADRCYVLQRGRVVMEGTGQEMRGRIGEIETTYLSRIGEGGAETYHS